MSPIFKYIYLGLVIGIVGILYMGIYRSGPNPDRIPEGQSQEGSQEFQSLAAQQKEIRIQSLKAEERIKQAKVDPEFEKMILIPAGKFTLGHPKGSAMERPAREVFLDGYTIDKYEVNFAQYYSFISATKYPRKPRLAGYLAIDPKGIPILLNPYSPVVGVSWEDAASFCYWKGKRLPTEAEWEKAAKGTTQRFWPWGDEENPKLSNLVGSGDGFRFSSPVGSLRGDISPYGVHDMAGNAMEWVANWFREDYYQFMPLLNPQGPERGKSKGIKGASWNDSILRAKTTIRFKTRPTYRDVTIGFRCALSST